MKFAVCFICAVGCCFLFYWSTGKRNVKLAPEIPKDRIREISSFSTEERSDDSSRTLKSRAPWGIDRLESRWKFSGKETLSDRTDLNKIISKMVKEGYSEKALKLIREDVGLGNFRNNLLAHLFCECARFDKAHLESLHGSLEFFDERAAAEKGLERGIGFLPEIDSTIFDDLSFLGEKRSQVLLNGLCAYVRTSYSPSMVEETGLEIKLRMERRFNEVLEMVEDRGDFDDERKKFLTTFLRYGEDISMEAFHVLEELGISAGEGDLRKFSRDLLASNSRSAMETLTLARDPIYVGLGFDEWMRRDSKAATAWFQENQGKLSKEQSCGVLESLTIRTSQRSDFEAAWDWAEKIEDDAVRKRVEGQLWSKERQVVRDAAKADPLRLIEDLRSGTSVHEEYWIREGFKTWFSSTPEAANEWYSEKKESLTQAQNQHVARAYAELALTEGDINLARQWAEQVVDPNFKQKLVEQIDAAAETE